MLSVCSRQAQVRKQSAACHQVCKPTLILIGFPRDRRIVNQFLANGFSEEFIFRQLPEDEVLVGKLAFIAHTMGQNDTVKALIDFRILDNADEWRQPGARANQEKIATRQQMIHHQGTGRLAAHQQLISNPDVLEAGSKGAVWHLNAEEL